MLVHSRLWWFVLIAVVFLLLATTLGRSATTEGTTSPPQPTEQSTRPPPVAGPALQAVPPPQPAPAPEQGRKLVQQTPEAPPAAPPPPAEASPLAILVVTLVLHVAATIFALRIGLKIFYESTLFSGFCMIVLIDAIVLAILLTLAPFSDGFTAMWGPQVVVTTLVMIVTLHHYGFSKDRFTVMPAVFVTKAFGFLAEVALRMLFLDALKRYAAENGL